MKYELTSETKKIGTVVLYRIKEEDLPTGQGRALYQRPAHALQESDRVSIGGKKYRLVEVKD